MKRFSRQLTTLFCLTLAVSASAICCVTLPVLSTTKQNRPDPPDTPPPDSKTQPKAMLIISPTVVSQNRPDPPDTPPPDNKREPGGGLTGSNNSCKTSSENPILLLPKQSAKSLTISEYPTFWFYIPYTQEDSIEGEFTLQTADSTKDIYRIQFKLPKTPGIVSISLPPSPEYVLEEGKYYRWFLAIYCNRNSDSNPDDEMYGSVKRVPKTAETERQINAGTPDIWYDSLTRLAQKVRTDPQNEKLKAEWANLLKSIGREDLAQEPVVGEVEVLK